MGDTEHHSPEELVKKWRREARSYPTDTDERAEAAAAAVRLCADELERSLHTATEQGDP